MGVLKSLVQIYAPQPKEKYYGSVNEIYLDFQLKIIVICRTPIKLAKVFQHCLFYLYSIAEISIYCTIYHPRVFFFLNKDSMRVYRI